MELYMANERIMTLDNYSYLEQGPKYELTKKRNGYYLNTINLIKSALNTYDIIGIEKDSLKVKAKQYESGFRTFHRINDSLKYGQKINIVGKRFLFGNEKETDTIPAIINVDIKKELLGKGYLNKRTLLSVSSCGICGKRELGDLKVSGKGLTESIQISADNLHKMHALMKTTQKTFEKTGGSHAAAIFNKKQELLTIKEDLGRHNAVDKSVGDLLIKQDLKNAHYLLVSGRVSYEIVTKAFIAKIPVIVAISACSSLAVDFAKEFGICLIGFTRNNKMTVYANPKSINNF